LLFAFATSDLCADLILRPFPPGTVLYHMDDATLTSVSATKLDKETGQDRITLAFVGEWQINPELHGAQIKPQAGVVIGADTTERKRRLEELRIRSSSLKGKKVAIYIYSGAVNKNHTTYAWPEDIKIVAAQ